VRRERRPWWRWNIITLAVALFVLVWVRELLGFGAGATWTCVFSIFLVWAVGPMLAVPTSLTTMAEAPRRGDQPSDSNPAPGWWRRNWMLVGLRILSQVLLVLSVIHLVIFLAWFFVSWLGVFSPGYGRYYRLDRFLVGGYMPMLEVFFSGCLYALCVIAMRLDRDYRDHE
jgi:hypothetical protein